MRKFPSLILTTALWASISLHPTLADDWHGRGDIHGFHDHDYDHWRGGNWFNGFHDGRSGWWWVVDGVWYYYPAPIYPYPDPYTPPTVMLTPGSPATVVQPAYVYYCRNPAGYYPYVPRCYYHWDRVAAPTAPTTIIVQQPAPPAPQVVVSSGNPHDADLQQLNAYAAKLQSIDLNGSHARAHLKDLEKQVEAFRQTLFKRSYNAMDVLQDAEDLKKRIAEQRDWLANHKGAIPSSTAAPASPPVSTPLPPGTAVTFPPQ